MALGHEGSPSVRRLVDYALRQPHGLSRWPPVGDGDLSTVRWVISGSPAAAKIERRDLIFTTGDKNAL